MKVPVTSAPYADWVQIFVDARAPEEGGIGDDANDGLSPGTPKRTITEAMAGRMCVNYVGPWPVKIQP